MNKKDFFIWFVGFFEGEGCFRVRNRGKKGVEFRLCVTQMQQRGKNVLEICQQYFNQGHVYTSKTENYSRFVYEICKIKEVRKIVIQMIPYMKVRKSEAEEFIILLDNWIYNKIRPQHLTWRDRLKIRGDYQSNSVM